MSISPIVDAGYRLQPADLEGAARQVVIANVTYQGVEEMTPVLHFAGQSKRLVLSSQQVEEIIDITGTTLFQQWVGTAVVLQPKIGKSESHILIRAVNPKRSAKLMPIYLPPDRRGWYLALTIVGLLLALSLIYVVLNTPAILDGIQQLRDNWPLR
jgi:hypothetical protein